MSRKLIMILVASLFAIGMAMSVNAGSIADGDTDGIPDVLDNCSAVANGPAEAPNNQVDTDGDNFGNRCDGDFNNVGATVDLADFTLFLGYGLVVENVQRSACKVTALQGGGARCLIDYAAAGGVDQNCASLHACDFFGPDHARRLR